MEAEKSLRTRTAKTDDERAAVYPVAFNNACLPSIVVARVRASSVRRRDTRGQIVTVFEARTRGACGDPIHDVADPIGNNKISCTHVDEHSIGSDPGRAHRTADVALFDRVATSIQLNVGPATPSWAAAGLYKSATIDSAAGTLEISTVDCVPYKTYVLE